MVNKCTVLCRHRDEGLPLWGSLSARRPLACDVSLKCSEIAAVSSCLRNEQEKLTKARGNRSPTVKWGRKNTSNRTKVPKNRFSAISSASHQACNERMSNTTEELHPGKKTTFRGWEGMTWSSKGLHKKRCCLELFPLEHCLLWLPGVALQAYQIALFCSFKYTQSHSA